jgi:hypothetical protein
MNKNIVVFALNTYKAVAPVEPPLNYTFQLFHLL